MGSGGFEESVADDLIERGLVALHQEERLEIAEEFQERFATEWFAPLVLGTNPHRFLLQGNIGGFDTNAGPWDGSVYRLNTSAANFYYV